MSEQLEQGQKAPTKEELIKFFAEQVEVKTVQFQLQELNTKLAVARAEELKALQFIAQMTSPQPEQAPNGTVHTITEQDLENNPELKDAGIKVGDEVILPEGVSIEKEIPEEEDVVEEKKSRKLKTA